MSEPIFDHERLNVFRLSTIVPLHRFALRKSLRDTNRLFAIVRGSALECAVIHEILFSFDAIDAETNQVGKSTLKRIVSMLTRLSQPKESSRGINRVQVPRS